MTSFKNVLDYIFSPFVFVSLVIFALIITIIQALWDSFKNPVWYDFGELVSDMWQAIKGKYLK